MTKIDEENDGRLNPYFYYVILLYYYRFHQN